MGKKRGDLSDGLKLIYQAYQLSRTMESVRGKGAQMLLAVKEAILFVLVLAASVGLLWAVTLVVEYILRVVN
jgi:hypothetical protein